MTDPATVDVVTALAAKGSTVRFVGGCVRDTLLGRPVKDVDIATPDTPERVVALLTAAGIKTVPTGLAHGTITAVTRDRHFEVTTLRRDVDTDGRHATVEFTDEWEADAGRRDFTFNALYADRDGTIYDPTGGLDDLAEGRVRFVGDAAVRIEEDHLRILRFFRFVAYFGRTAPDADAVAACEARVDLLKTLSAERVAAEVLRTLSAPEPTAALALMGSVGVLQAVLPEATRLEVMPRLRDIEVSSGFEPNALLRLASLMAPQTGAAIASRLARRLKLSNADKRRLTAYVAPPVAITPNMSSGQVHAALYRAGYRLFTDLVFLAWARLGKQHDDFIRLLQDAARWDIPVFPITGDDLKSGGIPEGPEIGQLLEELEGWWVEGDFRADREACLQRLRERRRHRARRRPAPR